MSVLPSDLKAWAAVAQEHAQKAEPHSFWWCVGRLKIEVNGALEPMLTAVVRAVCERWSAWPEHLIGRDMAGDAAADPKQPPLARGIGLSSHRATNWERHWLWWIACELTTCDYETIGRICGGRQAQTVRRVVCREQFFRRLRPGVKDYILQEEILPRVDRILIELGALPRTTHFGPEEGNEG